MSRPVVLSGSIPLAKLHGSVSWNAHQKLTEGRGGITGNALIVPPTHEKELPESLIHAQRVGESILQKSTWMVFFGFAFNPYDQVVLSLLQSCGTNLEEVLLVNKSSSAESQTRAAHKLWPKAELSFTVVPRRWTADVGAGAKPDAGHT